MSADIVYFFSNILLYLFWAISVDLICEHRFPLYISIPAEVLNAFGFTAILMLLPVLSVVRFVLGIILFVLIMLLLHRGKPVRIILVSVLVIGSVGIAEMIYMLLMPREASLSGELIQENAIPVYAGYLFLNAVILSILVVLIKFLDRKNTNRSSSRFWLLYPIFPIVQLATVVVYFQSYARFGIFPMQVVWLIILYLASDIVLYVSMQMASRNAELNVRNEILEEQVRDQEDYYRELTRNYEDIRKMRHDIDNHLYTMQALLEEGQIEEAAMYSQRVAKENASLKMFADCRNTVAAAYLEKKAEDLQNDGILFQAEIHLPELHSISNTDLICVFGNLLDNAQEACVKTEDPWIELNASFQQPYLKIVCRNACMSRTEAQQKKRRIPEMERGVGFTILSQLAERYDGEFRYKEELQLEAAAQGNTGVFMAEIILKD